MGGAKEIKDDENVARGGREGGREAKGWGGQPGADLAGNEDTAGSNRERR